MDILSQTVSPQVNLNMQGVDITGAKTFADVIRILLEQKKKNPGNPEGETEAEKRGTSISLPLRSAIVQQITLTDEEMRTIRQETIEKLTEYKIAQARKHRNETPQYIQNTETEIQEWMSIRIHAALQNKVSEAVRGLIGNIPLIGFHMEEVVAALLEGKIQALDRREHQGRIEQEQEKESEHALAA